RHRRDHDPRFQNHLGEFRLAKTALGQPQASHFTPAVSQFPYLVAENGRKNVAQNIDFIRYFRSSIASRFLPERHSASSRLLFGGLMTRLITFAYLVILASLLPASTVRANDEIPKAAWKRPIGAPL